LSQNASLGEKIVAQVNGLDDCRKVTGKWETICVAGLRKVSLGSSEIVAVTLFY
jgi:hypothetical protein